MRSFFLSLLLCSATFADEGVSKRLVPLPPKPIAPKSNPTTPAKIRLGQQLFFDTRLSGGNTMSCATCHVPDKSYGDGKTRPVGENGKQLERNTQSCLNVGFYEKLFWDGRTKNLEEQALVPIQSPAEMNQGLGELEAELLAVPEYVSDFQSVFGTKPSSDAVAKALAAFQRSLVTGPSPFDAYLQGDRAALSRKAQEGLELFRGEAGCIDCHHGPLLSDGKFYRLGLFNGDRGREKVTGKKDDRYRFRTPSLRNIADTGPYMHDGSMKTLEEVVTFYFRGIPDTLPGGLTPDTSALVGQSFSEIDAVVEFLKSLSGSAPEFSPPSVP